MRVATLQQQCFIPILLLTTSMKRSGALRRERIFIALANGNCDPDSVRDEILYKYVVCPMGKNK